MSAHTKGFWKLPFEGSVCVVSENGAAIAYTDTFLPHEECVANAQLIAALPDLAEDAQSTIQGYDWFVEQLENFKAYQGSWTLEVGDSWADSIIAHIKSRKIGTCAAIAKASGLLLAAIVAVHLPAPPPAPVYAPHVVKVDLGQRIQVKPLPQPVPVKLGGAR